MSRSVAVWLLLVMMAWGWSVGCDCSDNGADSDAENDDDDNDNNNDDDDNDDNNDNNDNNDATPPTYCEIDGVIYGSGYTHPQNPCLICDPMRDPDAWSLNEGADCDDGLFCNGADSCLAGDCQVHHENVCPDNGLFCDGIEVCIENEDRCAAVEAPSCPNDGLFCNGEEFCNEDLDSCDRRLVPSCPDDGLFCTGAESCSEMVGACIHEGDPCLAAGAWCDENEDMCRPIDCAAVAAASIDLCGRTLADIDDVPQDAAALQAWCEASEALFPMKSEIAAPFWNCWADCIFVEGCSEDCFTDCLLPPAPGAGCEEVVHEIYRCGGYATYDFWSRFFIPGLDLSAACSRLERDWDCDWDCVAPLACETPPTPLQTQAAIACVVDCDPNPAMEFIGPSQCARVPDDEALDAPEFTLEMWVRIDQLPEFGAFQALASRLQRETGTGVAGWELGMIGADFDFYSVHEYYFTYADATGSVLIEALEPLVLPELWRHLALQYDGSRFLFFIDGTLRDIEWFSGPLRYAAVDLGIGCAAADGNDDAPASGWIDEVRLTDMALYNDPSFSPRYENNVTPATIALWRMNEEEGATLTDEGPLGLDGTLSQPDLRGWRIAKNRWSPTNTIPYNSSAYSAGRNARLAEELYYQNSGGGNGGCYCDNLAGLLVWDRNLTDDPEVTFVFGPCNSSGYTFMTRHHRGDEVHLMHD